MRRFGACIVLGPAVLYALVPRARAAGDEPKERIAHKACLSGNYQKGVEILSDLFVSTKNPTYIYNQARCFEQNGRCEEAINRFREYLRKAKDASVDDKSDAERHIADCQTLLGQKLVAEPPPPKAESVPTPTPPSGSPNESTQVAQVEASLASLPTSAAASSASEQAISTPGRPTPGRSLRIAGIICGVVGIGSIATAVYFYTRARSFSDRVSNQPVPNPSDESAGKNAQTMQWVFYGIGGAALGTGALLYAFGWPTADNGGTTSIVPLIGPGLAGISARGAY